jgi:signal transduction histidine kinase
VGGLRFRQPADTSTIERRQRVEHGRGRRRRLQVRRVQDVLRIEVFDRGSGSGMIDAVLTNALVPFYSTKRSGTGLGLALAREIAEAHGGRILLSNREGGGLAVTMILPALAAP